MPKVRKVVEEPPPPPAKRFGKEVVLPSGLVTPTERKRYQATLGTQVSMHQIATRRNAVVESIAGNMMRWHRDPWEMIQDGVIYTLDQVNMKQPIKTFPTQPYLKELSHEWLENKLLLVAKSRRMTVSWLMCFLHLWLTMFHEGIAAFIVSDSERKSAELIQRCEFIYDHIPEDVMLKPKIRSKHCLLEFPGLNSFLMGIPEGADQLRGYTATALLFDEFAFWDKPRESLGAARPCIDGGGRVTIVSSPLEGPFQDLVFDNTM
jgi:hypothetical protein